MILASCGTIDITPKQKMALFGYANRVGYYDDIWDSLQLNAVILKHNKDVVIFLSADLLYITDEIKNKVLKELQKKYSISEEAVLWGATHNHCAPAVDDSKPLLGIASSEYIEFFISQSIKLLNNLFSKKETPVDIYYGKGIANHAIYRRNKVWSFKKKYVLKRDINLFPNKNRMIDETIHTIIIKDRNNKILGIIWNYACHTVAFPFKNMISADYPGIVRNILRENLNNQNIAVIFYQGFSGDINPFILNHSKSIKVKILKILNKGQSPFGQFTINKYKQWAHSLSNILMNVIRKECALKRIDIFIKCKLIKVPLNTLVVGNVNDRLFSIQKISLSKTLHFIGISAEPVVEYVNYIKNIFFDSSVIPVGYINSVFGYLPTRKIIEEGGYEGKLFFPYFNINGHFIDEIEKEVINLIRDLK